MAYIDVRVHFDSYEEDDYTGYEPKSVEVIDSDISDEDRDGIAESAGQSDIYTVNVSNAFLYALGEEANTKVSI